MKTYIGCDPGKSGALAIISECGVMLTPFDEQAYIERLSWVDPKQAVACIEHVHAMPKQGVTSMFNFGLNFGWIQGVFAAKGIPFELVTPQKWKKEFSITADKNTAIAVCKRLFPDVDLRRTERCTKEHDGMCEALLMAEYARRKFG